MEPIHVVIFYIIIAIGVEIVRWILFLRRLRKQAESYDDLTRKIETVGEIFYLCDCRDPKCGPNRDCDSCHHTSDITHASNFVYDNGAYWEKEVR